jgi:hypothetical protein
MNEIKAILAIAAGCAMIFFGFTIKQFYVAKGMYGRYHLIAKSRDGKADFSLWL